MILTTQSLITVTIMSALKLFLSSIWNNVAKGLAKRFFTWSIGKLLSLKRADFDAAVRVILSLDGEQGAAMAPDEKREAARQLLFPLVSQANPEVVKRITDGAHLYVRIMQLLGVAEWRGFQLLKDADGNPRAVITAPTNYGVGPISATA